MAQLARSTHVLLCHAQDKVADPAVDSQASGTTVGAAIVLLGDELPVPAQDRVGGDDAGDLAKGPSAQGLALGGKATPLRLGEAKTPSSELLSEDTVFLLEVGDHVLVSPIDPAGEDQQEIYFDGGADAPERLARQRHKALQRRLERNRQAVCSRCPRTGHEDLAA